MNDEVGSSSVLHTSYFILHTLSQFVPKCPNLSQNVPLFLNNMLGCQMFMSMDPPYDLQERLNKFAIQIVEEVRQLPKDAIARQFGGQLVRSGTSPALHYGEAKAASSRKDFIHKMRVCLKELRETLNCITIMNNINLLKDESLLTEADELVAIFVSSVKTAERKRE